MQAKFTDILNYFIRARSTAPDDAFRERAVRVIVLFALVFFSSLNLWAIITGDFNGESLVWYGLVYVLSFGIYVALHDQRIDMAVRLIMPAMLLIVVDPTAAYWSPGTILLGVMFTFIFQLLVNHFYERFMAVFINLGIYTYLTISSTQSSPLPYDDYFSQPVTAILTVYIAHSIIIAVVRFIREQQKMRDQQLLLLEQQRVDVLRQFLGHSSHDLRTLLTRISTGIYITKRKLPKAEQDVLSRLENASQDLEKLVLNMLEMAQLGVDTQLERVDTPVDNVLKDVVDRYREQAKQKSQTIQLKSQTTFAHINADVSYLGRALGNILENAILYSPNDTTIEIITRTQRTTVTIIFQDHGMGIAEQHLPHIFDSFYRIDEARNQSTGLNGLGLSIAKKIIELHRGTITVESEINIGSRFTVTLPMR